MKLIAIIGARPQFIKHFPFEVACKGKINLITVHTGQHYDPDMSDIFFKELGMSQPDFMLDVGSGQHGVQTANMMIEIENIVLQEKPDGLVVYGDTNSTLAGALVAAKLHIPIFHIEAGLRSYNKDMPEEINRLLTDHISDLLFTPSEIALHNLHKEGINQGIYVVGDIMKDLVLQVKKKDLIGMQPDDRKYYYVTLHRPYNTDDPERLRYILLHLNTLNNRAVMALHPRTKNLMEKHGIEQCSYSNISFINPQSYFDNLTYLFHAKGLITDSGGMQKEAYWLKKKCVTIRTETEWVETVDSGGNVLLFDDLSGLCQLIEERVQHWDEDLYGDGNAAIRMVEEIVKFFK